MSSQNFLLDYFNSQPFFGVSDDAFVRMMETLKRGEPAPTYLTQCPHRGKPNPEAHCKCPQFENILEDGFIMRKFGNKTKPVLSETMIKILTGKI